MAFHEIQFPVNVSQGARGGPRRKTQIVALANGDEERNASWLNSRREYDVAYGVRNADALAAVVAFFEARNGMLYGFRFKDWSDYKSCLPLAAIAGTDQPLGTTDGVTAVWPLVKTYVSGVGLYARNITKPVAGTVLVTSTVPAGPELVANWDNPRGAGWSNFSSTGAISALTYAGFINAYEIGFVGAGRREQGTHFTVVPTVKYRVQAWMNVGTGATASLATRNTTTSEISGISGPLSAPTINATVTAGAVSNVSAVNLTGGVWLWSFDIIIAAGLTSMVVGAGNTVSGQTMILYGISLRTPAVSGPASGWSVDTATGLVTFASPPVAGGTLTAGFEFDVPVRFDTDMIDVALKFERLGSIQSIPLIEVRK